MIGRGSLIVAALCATLRADSASAQTGANILLVTNALSEASDDIGEYYAGKRAVPNEQILRLPMPTGDDIERREYEQKIEQPIARWLMTHAAQDRILYILLTKGVPLRIAGTEGPNGTVSSVDSELTLLYRKLSGGPSQIQGSIRNPYFVGDGSVAAAVRFSHRAYDIFLVGRLDGYTVADVKAMIDRGLTPAHQGRIVLDGKLELTTSVGNKWLQTAATALARLPGWSDRVVLDLGQPVLTNQPDVIGFYTWGSNAVSAKERRAGHQFLPGAIAGEYVSTDARTFKEPPDQWTVNDTRNPFGGSHQSLIGDFIRDGVTGVAGHVAEPYLNATIRPDVLFPAYVSGFNLIESFYLAMPSIGWQTVVVGDPLCSPFGAPPPQATTDLSPAIDPTSELPAFFLARRIAALATVGAKPDVAVWAAKAEVRLAHNDQLGAREALERATTIDQDFTVANMMLATMYEGGQEWDAAIGRYQQILKKSPNHPAALNNLAYILATQKKDPAAAFPLATQAYAVSVQDPVIADTLAWIYHLMGNDAAAEPIISAAVRRRPESADILLHAAFILAGTGKSVVAGQYLTSAIKQNPTIESRADVKELRLRLTPAK